MIQDIVQLLLDERAKIDQALSVLRGRPPALLNATKKKRGGVWTPERRAAQARRVKALWKKGAFNGK